MRYIVQMRRGTISQWEENDIVPLVGEIVIELDETNKLHKLKIGDGIHKYSELAYLMAGDEIVTQVLAQAIPRAITVTLDVNKWVEVTSATDPNFGYYGQLVTVDGVTNYSRLDLHPDADMLAEFRELDLVFVTENNRGILTVYSVGDMPLKTYTMQATLTETEPLVDQPKIVGTTVGTPTSQVKRSEMGVSNGVATLDADGQIPLEQIPVDKINKQASSEYVKQEQLFVGTQEEYEAAYAAGKIAIKALVIIIDDEDVANTSAVLGEAILGQMILQ